MLCSYNSYIHLIQDFIECQTVTKYDCQGSIKIELLKVMFYHDLDFMPNNIHSQFDEDWIRTVEVKEWSTLYHFLAKYWIIQMP